MGDREAGNGAGGVGSYANAIIAFAAVAGILYWARVVFITGLVAVITALILEPFVALLVRIRFPRAVASFVVCTLAALIVYFTAFAAYNQIYSIASDVPAFKENLANFVVNVSDRLQRMEEVSARFFIPAPKTSAPATPPQQTKKKGRKTAPPPAEPVNPPGYIPEVRIHNDRNPVFQYIYGQLGTLYQIALMVSFVPLLVYFMLSWREHIYQSFLRFFDEPARTTAARSLKGIAGMARAFVVGNFMIGVILMAVSSALFAVLKLPYPLLVGAVSGFLSLVPYAGLVLAVLPPILATLLGGSSSTVFFVATLSAIGLHVLAMNVLYPTLVGARVHLNPLVVTFSLMFWGFLWDAAGLVLAIPITAGVKAVCDNVEGLKKYGRFLGD
ncbi:MAG: AI-2E family transporter [Acidobacteriota bacterium]|nr:AI-2E family transporter [Acidobacteriota bacterium]